MHDRSQERINMPLKKKFITPIYLLADYIFP